MDLPRARPWWPALVLALLGLTTLYLQPLGTRFLNDDYIFLEQARTQPLLQSLGDLGALQNYYRPLSRQIYFAYLTPIAGGHPLVFHLVNYVLFLGSLALLADLLLACVPVAGAMAGVLYFALLPLQGVNLTWVSCSQDLMALAATLGALALHRRGRTAGALLAYLAAIASKESALPLPVALVAWEVLIRRERPASALRRGVPALVLGIVWAAVAIGWRLSRGAPATLHAAPAYFLAGYAHMVQGLAGLGAPRAMAQSLFANGPAVLPLLFLAPLAVWFGMKSGADEVPRQPPAARRVAGFAAVWLVAFGFVTGPVASTWSAYFYTLAAIGGALLVGLAFRRGDRWAWIGLTAFLLWWHAGSSNARTFAVADRPWGWTSHLTEFYFRRAATLTDTLSRQLLRVEPTPPRGTRFFFATLPPWAGFQMGNGALIRALYRDTTLESHFYSEFSETTADRHPVRFLYWDGAELKPLYAHARDPMFQVGGDLILLDRPSGAEFAFRRGLGQGESQMDLLYWLGWTELWLGRRGRAEAIWKQFGAEDDSLRWIAHLRAAHNALTDGDSIKAKRHLITAIEYGIGRPEAHAVLGEILMPDQPKYAMLELKVATWLNPRDWLARRDLALALVRAHLDDPAERELAGLEKIYPEWRSDSLLARARRTLEGRSTAGIEVPRF